jgi:MFS family permease
LYFKTSNMASKNQQRIYLSIFFFFSGFIFSSWASRIPTLKNEFNLNDAELGTLLLTLPVCSLISLPFSGWLVSKYDSRVPLTIGMGVNALSLGLIGFAPNVFTLILAVGLFAFSMRVFNISINTQALSLQKLFEKKIIGSFHGLWSTGGIVGVGYSSLLLAFNVHMNWHLLSVALMGILMPFIFYSSLLTNDKATSGNKLILGKPDPYIVYLGFLVFFAAMCEGGMFDWSGIYFQEIVKVKIFTTGYLIFMVFMALSRFLSDIIIDKLGMSKTYILSASLIVIGISMSIIFPQFWPALIGFSLVGLGTAAIVPMTYALAGKSKKYSPGTYHIF